MRSDAERKRSLRSDRRKHGRRGARKHRPNPSDASMGFAHALDLAFLYFPWSLENIPTSRYGPRFPDADAAIARAAAAGATVTMPAQPMLWGDLYGIVTDPFGHVWSLATPLRDPMTSAELAAALNTAPR